MELTRSNLVYPLSINFDVSKFIFFVEVCDINFDSCKINRGKYIAIRVIFRAEINNSERCIVIERRVLDHGHRLRNENDLKIDGIECFTFDHF